MQVKQDRQATTDGARSTGGADRPGDALVAFGITGDLATLTAAANAIRVGDRLHASAPAEPELAVATR